MLDKLKQKIVQQFPEKHHQYQVSNLFDLIQKHINNDGLEGEEIAGIIIINHLHNESFLFFETHMFGADMFFLK